VKTTVQETISPIDDSVFVVRELADPGGIEIVLSRAVAAQKLWKAVPVSERAAICRRMSAWLVEKADEIGRELTWQIGRPIVYSPFEIRRGFTERVEYMCDLAEAITIRH
jgi:acyl-CoA reductase-like NAD-dependent aldehyde dehydrogenase